ncbi:hypothetical protein ACFLTU_09140 [Bacteroidota bacterium]
MNKRKSTYCLIVILLGGLCCSQSVLSQIPYDKTYQEEALSNTEYITLITDRNMYAVNERIYFRSFYRKDSESANELWSKALYVELVTPSGMAVTNGKFRHNERGSSGFLTIPADVLTGNYYLRAYTRWMRNFGPGSYSYIPLTIINPFKQDVLKEGDESSSVNAEPYMMKNPGVECQTNKLNYAPGEEVILEISQAALNDKLSGEYCLTVVQAGLCDTMNAYIDIINPGKGKEFRFNYLPDIRGISISGSVFDTEDQSPVPRARLHFTSIGEKADYFGTITDELGRFILTLPDRTGTQELFVACESLNSATQEIRIDQDFATDPVPFRTKQFALSPEKKEVATRMVFNMQLSKVFEIDEASPVTETEADSFPFYGLPNTSVDLEKFVKLPTMTEVFVNLVPDVYVKYKRGQPYLNIGSPYGNISLFPPLVLIDQIPVFDQKAIFSIDPTKIERIVVINEMYVRGNIMFGGIISLSSKQGDMAAVDLPKGSYFFDYQGFHPGNSLAPYSSAKRIPDTRNTQLWIDRIHLDSGEKKTVQFPASSSPGEYHILVRGASPLGEIVYGVSIFRVE